MASAVLGRTVLRVERVPSPLGDLLLYMSGHRVCSLDFWDLRPSMEARLDRRYGRVIGEPISGSEPARQLARYLEGDISALASIPIEPGGMPFQRAVWEAMRAIEPGACRTYSWLAAAVGRPRAVRAVGAASAHNPIALVIPCHRVVGADGSLVGYAGGVERKRWLLHHERGAMFSAAQEAALPGQRRGLAANTCSA